MTKCVRCGREPLENDEIGLTRKIVNRGTVDFYCFECLSEHFGIPVPELKKMVAKFRKAGCTLFAPE